MHRINEQYSYITHPEGMPLELNGSSKKRVHSAHKQHYQQHQCSLNQEGRSVILKKLSDGKKDSLLTKSILPGNQRRREPRPSSVRVFNENKENIRASGVDYLMQKTQQVKLDDHIERAHFNQRFFEPRKTNEKKHYDRKSQNKEEDVQRPMRNKETQKAKVLKDIHSNVYRRQSEQIENKKLEQNNLFRKGQDLGYEAKRVRRFSDMKMIEMVGSQHVKQIKPRIIDKRQDWRLSNINFF